MPGPAGIAPLVFSSGATLRLRDRHTHRQVPWGVHDSPRGEAPNMSLGDKTRGECTGTFTTTHRISSSLVAVEVL